MKKYRVYMLECSDGTIYTGITTDWKRRLNEHNSGRGAKYVSKRIPAHIVYLSHLIGNRSDAMKVEYGIKQWNRRKKLSWIKANERETKERIL
tara:strand:- start:877 stop:1155 length:279 start_codon:yes stop_codon:yes gene_type:complete